MDVENPQIGNNDKVKTEYLNYLISREKEAHGGKKISFGKVTYKQILESINILSGKIGGMIKMKVKKRKKNKKDETKDNSKDNSKDDNKYCKTKNK